MNFKDIKLDKSMYKNGESFSKNLERLDPSGNYQNTQYKNYDAFERQLKRYDIKISGDSSDTISKFFKTSDSAVLFPEYVSRVVAMAAKESGLIGEVIASRTNISSLDYRSIRTELTNLDSDCIGEGELIKETAIKLNDNLVKMQKKGRVLSASYEAIMFQRIDVMTVALKQIGMHISKEQFKDLVDVLINGNDSASKAEVTALEGTAVTYGDLLALWNKFEDFQMNTLIASPDMALDILKLDEFKDPLSGAGFSVKGELATPMGAKLIRSSAVPDGTLIALDKRFAVEMVSAGDITVEYDKLIDTQLERAAVTSIYGFSKIFPDAVKVLKRA